MSHQLSRSAPVDRNVKAVGVGASPAATASAKPGEQKEPQSLTLKVMRLSKPGFQTTLPVLTERLDVPGQVLLADPAADLHPEGFGVSDFLQLPSSFGNIFLGERFVSYISITNHTTFEVNSVAFKAELQTTSQRFALLDNAATPVPTIAAGDCHDFIVQYEIKEPGIHILVCSLSYLKLDGQQKQFRKFFKFQVSNPLEITTATHDLQHGMFVEAQVQNAAPNALYIEAVRFEPMPLFNVTDLNRSDAAFAEDLARSTASSWSSDLVYLKPNDVRQYLFRLDPRNPSDPRVKTQVQVGKMEITWRSNLGEIGRMQATNFERRILEAAEVELAIRNIPKHVVLEQPFTIQCEITNRTDKPIDARLQFVKHKASGIFFNGISGQEVARLAPGGTQTVSLSLFPIKPGVQKITGLCLVEEDNSKMFEFDDLVDVYVET